MLLALRPATGPVPVPERVTDCVLPVALLLLSVTTSEAERLPETWGANVTLMVQLLPAPTELPQLFVWAKALALLPVNPMLLREREAFPVLLSVTVCAELVVPRVWLLKVKLAGLTPAVGAVPVPLRLTVCGLVVALSVMLKVAERLPGAVGVNVTLIVQVALAATELPQVLVSAKSPGLVPVGAIPLMPRAVFPELVRVTVWAALVDATA